MHRGVFALNAAQCQALLPKKGHTAAREAEEPPDDVSNQEETV